MFFFNVLSIVRLQWELFIHTPRWGAPGGLDRGKRAVNKLKSLLWSFVLLRFYLIFGFLKEKCCTFADLSLLAIK